MCMLQAPLCFEVTGKNSSADYWTHETDYGAGLALNEFAGMIQPKRNAASVLVRGVSRPLSYRLDAASALLGTTRPVSPSSRRRSIIPSDQFLLRVEPQKLTAVVSAASGLACLELHRDRVGELANWLVGQSCDRVGHQFGRLLRRVSAFSDCSGGAVAVTSGSSVPRA